MVDLDIRIKNIQEKLQQLLKQQNLLLKENQRLKKELEKTQLEIAGKDLSFQQMQQKIDTLKLGSANLDDAEKNALARRIDLYLREIDKCLALLNT